MAKSPDGILLARLVGGDFDDGVFDLDEATEMVRVGGQPFFVAGSPEIPEAELEAMRSVATYWEYRFTGRVQHGDEGLEAVFEFVRKTEEPIGGPSA